MGNGTSNCQNAHQPLQQAVHEHSTVLSAVDGAERLLHTVRIVVRRWTTNEWTVTGMPDAEKVIKSLEVAVIEAQMIHSNGLKLSFEVVNTIINLLKSQQAEIERLDGIIHEPKPDWKTEGR